MKVLTDKRVILALLVVLNFGYIYYLTSRLDTLKIDHALLISRYEEQVSTIDRLKKEPKVIENILVENCKGKEEIQATLERTLKELNRYRSKPEEVEVNDQEVLNTRIPSFVLDKLRPPRDES